MMTATYSPEDNKLRLYSTSRLDPETYQRVRAAGFIWAPKQDLFVAPMWTPDREDVLLELCGEIGDEDTSLVERAEDRAERFEDYSDARRQDYEQAHRAVSAIADNIPLGQPILVGHHSEKRARKDAERIENGMRRAVKMWDTANYWQRRAAGAIRAAKYKERPDVRARRIKKLEAELRKCDRRIEECRALIGLWNKTPEITRQRAVALANHDRGYWSRSIEHRSGYVGPMTLWEAAGGNINGVDPDEAAYATPAEIRARALANHEEIIAINERWAAHYRNRLEYERAMLGESGGTAADKVGPEKGGACKCWVARRGQWCTIVKVNKVSVTLLDNWDNGGKDFTRTVPFDQLKALMTKAQVDEARAAGRIVNETPRGFWLMAPPSVAPVETLVPPPAEKPEDGLVGEQAVDALRDALKAGVQVAVAPQLFPTPPAVARQVIALADIEPGMAVLEPSAGTGNLLDALPEGVNATAVELNRNLSERLLHHPKVAALVPGDFLDFNPGITFERIVMNPPFKNGADIQHVQHALSMLAPGGRLVSIVAAGPRQQAWFGDYDGAAWIPLPDDTFAEQGTSVRTAIVVIDKAADARQGIGRVAAEPASV